MKILGENIRKYRKRLDIDQRELADFLGITVSAVSQYETGKRSPSMDSLVKMADKMRVSTDALLGRSVVIVGDESSNEMVKNELLETSAKLEKLAYTIEC